LTIARAPSDVLDWLAGTPKPWHEQIAFVAIDMSPGYRAAIRTGLPTPKSSSTTSTSSNSPTGCSTWCTTATLRGRRGRACDPEWKARRRFLRNREDLTDDQFTRMWNQLIDTGSIGMTLPHPLDRQGTTA
jgi:transposase